MALPPAFDNEAAYMEDMLDFLKEQQIYYNYPNTDVLVEDIINKINLVDLDSINVFGEDFDIHQVPELNTLLDRIIKLRSCHERQQYEDVESIYFDKVPLGPKKKHEIGYLSQQIHRICQENGSDMIVDFGCGLGYLDQLLFEKFNYRILGLEHSDNILRGARKRQKHYHKESIDYVKYVKHYVNGASDVVIESLLNEHFPASENFCIVGLHACADLTVDAIRIFMKTERAKCLVLMPCCYHKMSVIESGMTDEEINKVKVANGSIDSNNFVNLDDNKDQAELVATQNVLKLEVNEALSNIKSVEKCSSKSINRERPSIGKNTIDTVQFLHTNVHKDLIKKNVKDQHFCNFPLSQKLKAITTVKNGCSFLRIPFLRLAAQPPSVNEDLDLLVFRMMSRAVLQLYCHKHNQCLVKKKRRAVKLNQETKDFQIYIQEATVNGYLLKCNDESCTSNETDEPVNQTLQKPPSSCKCKAGFDADELMKLWKDNSSDLSLKRAAILILLQRQLQPMFENLVLYDRIVYMKEMGIINCKFVKVVDDRISPRCLALVAAK